MLVYVAWTNLFAMLIDHMEDALFYSHLLLIYIHDIDIIMPACTAVFDTFHPLSCYVLLCLISKLNKPTCVLDPFPT